MRGKNTGTFLLYQEAEGGCIIAGIVWKTQKKISLMDSILLITCIQDPLVMNKEMAKFILNVLEHDE